jgi:Predicted acetyltransferase involved in intracellular survival and related acetyltransferases
MLTVSEATIYGRYGFGPSAMAADLEIETRRARWTGPEASGRVHFVSPQQLQAECRAVYERARLRTPGEIELDDYLWGRFAGVFGDDEEQAKQLRALRYDDAEGTAQGFAIYRVSGGETDFTKHTVRIQQLLAATDDAYAGLWRHLLELDLVTTVSALLRSVDEPVRWQIADARAVRATHMDHLWTRILNVPEALSARTYAAPGMLVFEVTDPLGFAAGLFAVSIDGAGAAQVTQFIGDDPLPADAAALALSVNELSSLYLGGVSAHTLARAGRVRELTPGAADAADASFRSAVTPWLSSWF